MGRVGSFICILGLLCICFACNEKTKVKPPSESNISVTNLMQHTKILAHDSLQGRGAGYAGEFKAAKYIALNYLELGLKTHPNSTTESFEKYLQDFEFHSLGSKKAWEKRHSRNVVGYIKGVKKPSEYIVIGAHYDGQGMQGQDPLGRNLEGIVSDSLALKRDSIWNSAVDNAVSISAMLEIARIIKERRLKLRRSVIFVAFGAEESALEGSVHFVNHLPVSLESLKAMINLEKLVGDPEAEFLYVSYGTSAIFEETRLKTDSGQEADLTPFFPDIIADTDHYPFTQRKIPAITMGTGSEINIHSPLDHFERVDYELLSSRTEYILNYLIELANADSDFLFTADISELYGITGGPATKEEIEVSGSKAVSAFKISAVVKESKGDSLGIQSGDLIVALNGKPLERKPYLLAFEDLLGEEVSDIVDLTIIRNKKILSISLRE